MAVSTPAQALTLLFLVVDGPVSALRVVERRPQGDEGCDPLGVDVHLLGEHGMKQVLHLFGKGVGMAVGGLGEVHVHEERALLDGQVELCEVGVGGGSLGELLVEEHHRHADVGASAPHGDAVEAAGDGAPLGTCEDLLVAEDTLVAELVAGELLDGRAEHVVGEQPRGGDLGVVEGRPVDGVAHQGANERLHAHAAVEEDLAVVVEGLGVREGGLLLEEEAHHLLDRAVREAGVGGDVVPEVDEAGARLPVVARGHAGLSSQYRSLETW